MSKIVWDLDGVLRDFGTIYHERFKIPQSNDWNFKYKDKGVYDWVKEDYSILVDADPTPYFSVIKDWLGGNEIEIWSHQPEDWIPYTRKWLDNHLKDQYKVHYLTPKEKYAKLNDSKDTFLVDDYPFFEDYKKIILIDYDYNKDSKSVIRIKDKHQLRFLLGESVENCSFSNEDAK